MSLDENAPFSLYDAVMSVLRFDRAQIAYSASRRQMRLYSVLILLATGATGN